jgi:hypothetical protein
MKGPRRCISVPRDHRVLVSGGGRDESFESFGWSLPLEGHAWSLIEQRGDVVELLLGVRARTQGGLIARRLWPGRDE